MGSPASVVIVNMVMEDVEQRALVTSPVKPFFWRRYVVDAISAVFGNEVERFPHLNSVEPSIQLSNSLLSVKRINITLSWLKCVQSGKGEFSDECLS